MTGELREPAAASVSARGRAARAAERSVGHNGRLVSWSKSAYRSYYPHHLVVFNAELALRRDEEPFWRGDLDLTYDEPRLRELAARLRRPLRVLPEHFGGADQVAVIHPDGRLYVHPSWGTRSRAGIVVGTRPGAPRWSE
jgi:hypothetical protein